MRQSLVCSEYFELLKRQKNIGIAYIEFKFTQSVPLAIGLSGQPLNGVPIIVQQSLAEKNRHAQMMETTRANLSKLGSGPIKVSFHAQLIHLISKLIHFFS